MLELDIEPRLAVVEAKEEVREFIASYRSIADRVEKSDDPVAHVTRTP
jgi:hypothetical protein